MRNLTILFLSTIILLASCSKEGPDENEVITYTINDLEQYGYFPLHVGNEWDYLSGQKVRTDTQETVDDIDYYRFLTTTGNWADTSYYRAEKNRIFEKRRGRSEILKFDFVVNENDTWTYNEFPESPFPFKATLQDKKATVETENFEFTNCYQFYYDIPEYADDEHEIFLAKGIGKCKQINWGGYPEEPGLIRVKIDGKEVNF